MLISPLSRGNTILTDDFIFDGDVTGMRAARPPYVHGAYEINFAFIAI